MKDFINSTKQQINNSNSYISDYPEVFFTNNQHAENSNLKNNNNSNMQTSGINPELIKQFLPLIFNNQKNSSNNKIFELLLTKFNPKLSNMFSMLNTNNQTNIFSEILTKKESDTPNIIDMSDYKEVN